MTRFARHFTRGSNRRRNVSAIYHLRDNFWLETSVGWLRGTELDLLSRLSTRDFVYARLKVYF